MLRVLEQLSMPSRADFISLADRVTNIEMRLDDMDAKLDQIVNVIVKPATTRTRPAAPRRQATPKGKKGKGVK